MPKKKTSYRRKTDDIQRAKDQALKALEQSPTGLDWNAIHKTANYLERAKLADYVEMMNHPWRSIWPNLVAGMARGAGLVLGGSIIGVLLMVVILAGLKAAFQHAGGMPVVGVYVEQAVGWVLNVIDQHKAGQ